MALVIISGLPCAGRTSVTQALTADFEQRLAVSSSSGSSTPPASTAQALPRRILTVSDHSVHTARSAYSAQVLEKPARASYLSAVSRALARDAIVLADGGAGLNIKGFRYQLWCAAREQGVRCVTLHVYATPEECKRRNAARRASQSDSYDEETIDDMLKRFEEPNAMTRWDSPLFLVRSESPSGQGDVQTAPTPPAIDDDRPAIPYDDIWKAAVESTPRKAPAVVVPHRQTTSNYISALESITQSIISQILASQTLSTTIPVPLPSTPSTTLPLQLPPSVAERPLTLSALQRLRRQFVKMHSTGLASGSEIASARDSDTRAIRSGPTSSQEGKAGSLSTSAASKVAEGTGQATEDEIAVKFVGWLGQTL